MSFSLPLPSDDGLSPEVVTRLGELPAMNVYRMVANAPRCLIPWSDMVKAIYESQVPVRYREVAILRQATKANSAYELHQHKQVAMENGLTDAEIGVICSDEKVTTLTKVENAICDMADQIETLATVSDKTLSLLEKHFDVRQLTELIITTSFYCCVARVMNVTRVPIESESPLAGLAVPV
jgi:alkylhydroperoxidase family enzyme